MSSKGLYFKERAADFHLRPTIPHISPQLHWRGKCPQTMDMALHSKASNGGNSIVVRDICFHCCSNDMNRERI